MNDNSLEWEFDVLKPKWHPEFDVKSVPDVEMAQLPFGRKIGYLEKWKEANNISPPKEKEPNLNLDTESSPPSDVKPVTEATKTVPKKPLSRAAALLEKV